MTLKFDHLIDRYTIQARLSPALITLAPLAVGAVSWIPKPEDTLKPLLGIAGAAGVVLLLAHISRTAGKRLEKRLLQNWGGWPSTTMFRLGDDRIDLKTKERYRSKLLVLMADLTLPSLEAEAQDPGAADADYRGVTTYLIGQTRDEKAFPLVLTENINYGFRRNLLGLKPIGLILAVIGIVASVWRAATLNWTALPLFGSLTCLLLALVWLGYVTPDWVLEAAEDYARRLFESIDRLPVHSQTKGPKTKRKNRPGS